MQRTVDRPIQHTDKGEFVVCSGEKDIDNCPLCSRFKCYVSAPETYRFFYVRCFDGKE